MADQPMVCAGDMQETDVQRILHMLQDVQSEQRAMREQLEMTRRELSIALLSSRSTELLDDSGTLSTILSNAGASSEPLPGTEPVKDLASGISTSRWPSTVTRGVRAMGCCLHSVKPVELSRPFAKCVNSGLLDAFANFMVVVQCVVTGFAIDQGIKGEMSTLIMASQHVCLVLYFVEIGIRAAARGKELLWRPGFCFDIFLISVGVAHVWVLPNLSMHDEAPGFVLAKKLVSCAMVLRTLRLWRAARASNFMVYKLMVAVRASIPTVVSAAVLIALGLYFAGCIAIELFTSDMFMNNGGTRPVVDSFFSSLPVAMVSLLRLVTLDDASSIYEPIVHYQPWTAVFFLLVFLSLAISLLNIITGDLVDRSMKQSRKQTATTDLERRRIRYGQEARRLFDTYKQPASAAGKMREEAIVQNWQAISKQCNFSDDVITAREFCEYFVEFNMDQEADQESFEKAVLTIAASENPLLTKITRIMEKKLITGAHSASISMDSFPRKGRYPGLSSPGRYHHSPSGATTPTTVAEPVVYNSSQGLSSTSSPCSLLTQSTLRAGSPGATILGVSSPSTGYSLQPVAAELATAASEAGCAQEAWRAAANGAPQGVEPFSVCVVVHPGDSVEHSHHSL